MGWLRGLVFLRSISRSLARIADSLDTLARIQSAEWERANPVRRKTHVAIESFDVDEANKQWRKEQVAAGIDPED
jgi:hypothetical protein